MRFSDLFKMIWWIVLSLVMTVLLAACILVRWKALLAGEIGGLEITVFLVWIALLLVPLFQEISLFGVQLKQAIAELKADVKEQITDFKAEIRNAIEFRANLSQQLYITAHQRPWSDTQLQELENRVGSLENVVRSYGVQWRVGAEDVANVSEDIQYLFGVRFNLEQELRRIWLDRKAYQQEARDSERIVPVARIIDALVRSEALDPELALIVRQIYSICSEAIHGRSVTPEQRRFVRKYAPDVVSSLRVM